MLNRMATHEPPKPLHEVPLTNIQPGGGLGPRLLQLLGGPSIAWFRNVCRPEDLPRTSRLLTSHPLRLARAGLPEAVFFSLLLGGVVTLFLVLALGVSAGYWAPAGVVLLLWLFVLSFF